jgi:DNA-binding transcriptional LysR family regulator
MQQVSDAFTIDLRRLRVLRELSRRRTLAATAEALHLTPSAVSQQLASLAREIGAPLIERQGRGVRLTGQARVLLTHADLIAAQLERARTDLAAWSDGRRATVTVGAFSSAITGLVAPAVHRLADRHPQLRVAVVEAEPPDLFTRLDAGDIDVAVAVDFAATPPHTDRRSTRFDLGADVLDLALPAAHPLAGDPAVPLLDLATEPWIVGRPDSCCGAITRTVCAAAGFTPDIRHAVDDWQSVAALVEAGAGVALIPRLVLPLHRAGVVLRPPAGSPPIRNLFAAVRAGSETSPALTTVIDQLRASGPGAPANSESRVGS